MIRTLTTKRRCGRLRLPQDLTAMVDFAVTLTLTSNLVVIFQAVQEIWGPEFFSHVTL